MNRRLNRGAESRFINMECGSGLPLWKAPTGRRSLEGGGSCWVLSVGEASRGESLVMEAWNVLIWLGILRTVG